MILASSLAIPRRKQQVDFLKGPAKVYDGAFDYDNSSFVANTFATRDSNTIYLVSFQHVNSGCFIFENGQVGGLGRPGEAISIIELIPRIRYTIQRNNNSRVYVDFDNANLILGRKYTFVMQKEGGDYYGFLRDNSTGIVKVLTTSFALNEDLGAGTIPLTRNAFTFGRRTEIKSNYFKGALKQFEIVNGTITATQRDEALAGGSLRSAGIAHNSGQYQLAVDFNKTDGNPPTTFANTPQYTITSFGGAQYVNYEDL